MSIEDIKKYGDLCLIGDETLIGRREIMKKQLEIAKQNLENAKEILEYVKKKSSTL